MLARTEDWMASFPRGKPGKSDRINFSITLRGVALTLMAVFLVLALIASILIGQRYEWTGFGPTTITKNESVPGKTFWDWLALLVIPITLAMVGYLFNVTERRQERRLADQRTRDDRRIASARTREDRQIAADQQQEAAWQTYLDRMGDLLINHGLVASRPDAEVNQIARAYTLTVLRRLDGPRKGAVIRFLSEASLIRGGGASPVLSLAGADLRGAVLKDADLGFADLQDAILEDADLALANLRGANLKGANLNGANLEAARGVTQKQVQEALSPPSASLPIAVRQGRGEPMNKKVEVDRLRGHGAVRLPNGTTVPTDYDVRVFQTHHKVVTNQGESWIPVDFTSFTCTLQHGGRLHAPLDDSGNMFLIMSDGRRLELLWKTYNLQYGVTEVVVTGGILPPEEPAT